MTLAAQADIVERLLSPLMSEDRMQKWDTLRKAIAGGDKSSWPRDVIESWLDFADQERNEAAYTISRLTADNEALRKGMESFRETLRIERDCRLNEVRLKEDAKNRADALAQGVERLKDDNHILARALFWFSLYPEYKPSPDFMEEVVSDLRAARPLVPSTRTALGDRP